MSVEHRRARQRGKSFEQVVAKALNGFRPLGGNRGVASSDVGGVPWSVECTRTAKGIKCLPAKWQQAQRNAAMEGKPAIVVAAKPRQPFRRALTLMEFGSLVDLVQENSQLRERVEKERDEWKQAAKAEAGLADEYLADKMAAEARCEQLERALTQIEAMRRPAYSVENAAHVARAALREDK